MSHDPVRVPRLQQGLKLPYLTSYIPFCSESAEAVTLASSNESSSSLHTLRAKACVRKMRSRALLYHALVLARMSFVSHAFVVGLPSRSTQKVPFTTPVLNMAVNTIFEGKPTERALSLNIRDEITKSSVLDVNGNSFHMNQLLSTGVSVVVFLRSLG